MMAAEVLAAEVGMWHGGLYLKPAMAVEEAFVGVGELDEVQLAKSEGDRRWLQFEATRTAARANMAATRDLAGKLLANLGCCDAVRPVLEAREILKPVKCERCLFYRAKLAGVESILYGEFVDEFVRGEQAEGNPVSANGSWGGRQVPQILVSRPEPSAHIMALHGERHEESAEQEGSGVGTFGASGGAGAVEDAGLLARHGKGAGGGCAVVGLGSRPPRSASPTSSTFRCVVGAGDVGGAERVHQCVQVSSDTSGPTAALRIKEVQEEYAGTAGVLVADHGEAASVFCVRTALPRRPTANSRATSARRRLRRSCRRL